jgi:hypothetical protein
MATIGQQGFDGNGWPATCRTLASAAPPIQDNNQLMWTVWGGGDKREELLGGIEPQKRVKVELIEWSQLFPTQLISNQLSASNLFRMRPGSKAAQLLPW